MRIEQSYIINVDAHLSFLDEGDGVIVGLADPHEFKETLMQVGFTEDLEIGESVLPSPDFGSTAEFNAEGDYEKQKDQPKEPVTHTRLHHWTEYHGNEEVEQSGLVPFTYWRYPREEIPPPATEFIVSEDSEGQKVILTESIEYRDENKDSIKHNINLFLEIFGACDVYDEDGEEIISPSAERKLNWEILPKGEYPWERLRQELEPVLEKASENKRPVYEHRLDVIESYDPDFAARGVNGFQGYVIYGFEDQDIYLCECAYYGNAIYIFDEDWEELSKMTKAEILHGDLHEDRIVHQGDWEEELEKLLEA